MPGDVEPPELARLLDFAERPRTHDWSLRAALVRYAQPEPERVSNILDVIRRIERALRHHRRVIERDGHELLAAVATDGPATSNAEVVELLRVTSAVDRLGDVLAGWAVDRAGEQPDAEVDAVTAEVAARLDALGVRREERTRPPRGSRPTR